MGKLASFVAVAAVAGVMGLAAGGTKSEHPGTKSEQPGTKADHQYDVRIGAISDKSFSLVKFDAATGRSWSAFESDQWKPIEDTEELPLGSYDVHVEQYLTGNSTNWQMYRINKATGQTWVLMTRGDDGPDARNRWREIKDAN